MVFRGQNYLSSAIRRVGQDVAGLSSRQQLQMRQVTAAAARERSRRAQQAARDELAAVQRGGVRYKAAQQSISTALTTQSRANLQIANAQNTVTGRELTLKRAKLRLQQAEKQAALFAKTAAAAALQMEAATTAQEMEKAHAVDKAAKERLSQARLQIESEKEILGLRDAQLLAAKEGVVIARQQLVDAKAAVEQAKLRKDRLAEQEVLLGQRVEEANRQLAIQNVRLAQATAMANNWRLQSIQNFSRQVEHAGRVAQMFGLIAVASFGYAAKAAADFNTQVTLAATQSTVAGQNTVSQVIQNAGRIQKSIQDMMLSGKTIAKPEELTKGIYDIFSGVSLSGNQQQQLQQGTNLLKEFNNMLTANAGMVSFDEVVQAGITVLNDFNVPLKEMPKALNEMQAGVRFGRMTMSQFLSTFNQAAPAAKAAGYSFNQMTDSITFLSRKFPSVRMAATGYARLTEILSRSAQSFREQGVEITNAHGKLLPMDQLIERLIKRWPQLSKGGTFATNFFKNITGQQGTIQARRVFTYFVQDLEAYRQISGQVEGDHNELMKSLTAAQKSTGVTWQEFLNQLRAIILVVGEGAIPAFKALAAPIIALIHWFQQLSPHTQKMIGYIGTMISAMVLLTGVIAGTLGGIISLGAGVLIYRNLKTAMQGAMIANAELVGGVEATNVAMMGLLRIGGFAAIVTGMILLAKATDGVRQALDVLMGSWVGWVAGIGAATFAVRQLQQAFIALGVSAKIPALMAIPGAVRNWYKGLGENRRRIADEKGDLMALQTNMRMYGGGTALRDPQTGRIIGRSKLAAEEVEKLSGSAGKLKAVGGAIGGAIGDFLPSLVVGGALMGGLYLWKRHLDAVHDALMRLLRAQQFVDRMTSGSKMIAYYRTYGDKLMDLEQKQINYNQALKDYNQAVSRGETGDKLRQMAINLASASRELRTASTAMRTVLSQFRQNFTETTRAESFTAGLQKDVATLERMASMRSNLMHIRGDVFASEFPKGMQQQINRLFGRNARISGDDITKKLDYYNMMLDRATRNLDKRTRQLRVAVRQHLQSLLDMRLIPQYGKKIMDELVNWITKLSRAPQPNEINAFIRFRVALWPGNLNKIPKDARAEYLKIRRLIQQGKPLSRTQLDWLIRIILKIDPKKPISQQLRNILAIVTSQIRDNVAKAVAAAAQESHRHGGDPVAPDLPKPVPPTVTTVTAQQRRIRGEWKMWDEIQRIVKLHQTAIHTNSYKDWNAYFRALNNAQKQWKGAQLDTFNALLDSQEQSLNDSTKKQKASFGEILTAVKSLYDGFKQQEESMMGALAQGPLLTSPFQQFLEEWGLKRTGKDYLIDIQKQNAKFINFHKQIQKFAKQGAPNQMVAEIAAMGEEEGGKMLQALAGLTPKQRREYFAAYARRQKLIEEYTKKDLNKQLNLYYKHGKNIALAILRGLRSENQGLETWLTKLVKRLFPGLPKEATTTTGQGKKNYPQPPKYTQPPPVTTTKGPKYVPPTVVNAPPYKGRVKVPSVAGVRQGTVNHNHNETTHIHVTHTGDPASIKNQVRQADIARRNRHTGRGPGPR